MNKLFIMVKKSSDIYGDTNFETFEDTRQVIRKVGELSSNPWDESDYSVERIFSVDEYGKVEHYGVQFKGGKFVLEPIPLQSPKKE
ncbi:hypothetical protein LJK88_20310 [Paenibacillus sp. P26]|nr:hypothetical protein LJK88_20310 [Paenibacillus sp. P26]UUZ96019.1 hypothetical protein LJK87_17565 [Paenibacillus sp. P25]